MKKKTKVAIKHTLEIITRAMRLSLSIIPVKLPAAAQTLFPRRL